MRSAKRYAFRLSSKRCSTCEDLRRVNDRIEATLRNARGAIQAHLTSQHSQTRGDLLAA
jgi:hypothetical protein